MNIENMSLGEIVTARPSAAALFESMQIDFCCKGKQKLSDVLSANDSKLLEVKTRLEKLFNKRDVTEIDFSTYSLSKLVDYIVETHHNYVREMLPVIMQHLNKVELKHGDSNPFILIIKGLFQEIKTDFEYHMMKEEIILFPLIKRIESGSVQFRFFRNNN